PAARQSVVDTASARLPSCSDSCQTEAHRGVRYSRVGDSRVGDSRVGDSRVRCRLLRDSRDLRGEHLLEPSRTARSLLDADPAAGDRVPPGQCGHLRAAWAETPASQPERSAARSSPAQALPDGRPVCAPARSAARIWRYHLCPPAARCHPAVGCLPAARLVHSSPTLCPQRARCRRPRYPSSSHCSAQECSAHSSRRSLLLVILFTRYARKGKVEQRWQILAIFASWITLLSIRYWRARRGCFGTPFGVNTWGRPPRV